MIVVICCVVIGYDVVGCVIVQFDVVFMFQLIFSGDVVFVLLWMMVSVLVDNDDDSDGCDWFVGLMLNSGLVICVVDMLFGGILLMYWLNSIDYGIVLSGMVELEFDNGVVMMFCVGDIVVQCGIIYLWCNFSVDIFVWIVFVLIEVMVCIVDGVVLFEVYF